jgi:hypothetical protein
LAVCRAIGAIVASRSNSRKQHDGDECAHEKQDQRISLDHKIESRCDAKLLTQAGYLDFISFSKRAHGVALSG